MEKLDTEIKKKREGAAPDGDDEGTRHQSDAGSPT
jgi:hypothetical protein